jgi:dTDP-4-amino-4,6-dideoxygalactose transaminase
MKYQYYKPAILNHTKLIRYIEGINDRRYFTNNGPLVRELKERLEAYLGIKNLLLVSSGTVALQVAYKALGLKGKIITTPLSFVATASAYKWLNQNLCFSDIDLDTLNLDPDSVTKHSSLCCDDAVVATHLYGNPCDIASFKRLSRRFENKTIYDASHAFATRYRGGSVLAEGDASVISFHATKLFHTIEGGGIVFASYEDYQRAEKMINFGFDHQGQVTEVGINAKMSELHAAVGLCVLDDIESIIHKKSEIAEHYVSCLSPYGVAFPKLQLGTDRSSPSYMPLILNSAQERDRLHKVLLEEGVETRKYFEGLINNLAAYSDQLLCLPNAEVVENRLLCLPFYVDLNSADISYICERVVAALDEIRTNA